MLVYQMHLNVYISSHPFWEPCEFDQANRPAYLMVGETLGERLSYCPTITNYLHTVLHLPCNYKLSGRDVLHMAPDLSHGGLPVVSDLSCSQVESLIQIAGLCHCHCFSRVIQHWKPMSWIIYYNVCTGLPSGGCWQLHI